MFGQQKIKRKLNTIQNARLKTGFFVAGILQRRLSLFIVKKHQNKTISG
ncbi:MAG: hypothetical protein JWR67_132 [Mucilaginibacter sp.]|nr:hypothetical protein [Mucilaginibacter sp.]MDB5109018.1 hypothetical protein [Mucilaginibacter sp.]